MFYVYILLCADSKLYIGYSKDIKTRLKDHSRGRVPSTKYRLPFTVICIECFNDQVDAKAREVYLKSGGGHQQLKHRHKNHFNKLKYLFR